MARSIRPVRPDDAEALAALHVATRREAYAHLLPPTFFDEEHLEGRRRMWRRITADPPQMSVVRIAETDTGEAIGLAMSGESTESDASRRARQLYMLYVTAEHHGSGVGQELLDAVLGDEPAMLWVAKENPRAIAFYRRNGFAFDGAEQTDPGAPRITDARMVR